MTRWINALVFSCVMATGCSLVLDTDVLQQSNIEPEEDSDTTPPVTLCQRDAECRDDFDCTVDQCGQDGQCVHLPNNSECGEFEYCKPDSGCTPTGDVCNSDDDCDDEISCTVDSCQLGACRNTVDHSLCSNAVPFCREEALCILQAGGCVEGDAILCDPPTDGICLTASCNEENGLCEEHLSGGADNDTDGALDVQCGGDDCDDSNADVYPAATEWCDGLDNDCDTVDDASFVISDAITVAEDAALNRVRVVKSGTVSGVLYEADMTHIALVDDAGTVMDFDLTTLEPGTPTSGDIVAVPSSDGTFYAVWNVISNGNTKTLVVAELNWNSTNSTVSGALVATLDSQLNPQATVVDCDILYDSARANTGWAVLWSESGSGDGAVFLQTHDMTTGALMVAQNTGTAATVSMAALGAADYLASFAANFTATSGGDNEVYEARIQYDTAFSLSTAASMISVMDDDGLNDTDPSLLPSTVADASGNWYTAFMNYSGVGNLRTILLWDGAAQVRQNALDTAVTHQFNGLRLLYDGEKLAMLYLMEDSTQIKLTLEQLVPTGVGGYDEVAETSLIAIAAGGTDSYLTLDAATTDDGMTIAWIAQNASTRQLQVTSLGTCSVQ